MSISAIMNTSLSALQANQTALRTVSNNVANINTEGYSRLDVNFISQEASGGLAGVQAQIQRAANKFLADAEMRSAADIASAAISATYLDRAQGLFGDPSQPGTMFGALDDVFADFGSLALDPSSSTRQGQSLSSLTTLLSQLDRTAIEISTLRDETNVKLQSAMEEANALMRGIADLNGSIRSATASGADASQAQTEQAGMLDRLSEIIDIRIQDGALGGVEVRTTNGVLLADTDAATLSFRTSVSPQQYPSLSITQPRSSTAVALEPSLQGGELYGLLKVRDSDLADLALGLGEFAAGVADALNAAHNNTTSVPAPATLVGDNTGLLSTDSLNFTGVSHVAITDADGRVVQNLEIDFDAGQITNAAGATTVFTGTIGALTTALNTALGADGSATFTNGSLTLSAAGAGNGVVVQQDETTPSSRSGRGFAHTFGLNNLVEHPTPLSYATGLTGTDAHGFTPGETLTFAFKDENGYVVRDVVYTVGAGATVADMVADMNTALGVDATASLAADGTLTITPTASSRLTSVDIAQDGTARGGTGVSVSELFGLGELAPAGRARGLQIHSDIASNPDLLGVAQADLGGAAVGDLVVAPGDGRGATLLSTSGATNRAFSEAGGMGAQTASVIDYGARLAGYAGSRAVSAENVRTAASAVKDEITLRRAADEGVNLDEELIKMTTYQQAYSAASRMIQAAQELYDTLLRLV